MVRAVVVFQGVYYFITGIWPLLDMPSFVAVTGPKEDYWLVRMVCTLTVAISLVFIYAALRNRVVHETLILIFGSSLSYMLIDVIYVLNGTIRTVYLGDAVLQILLLMFWTIMMIKKNVPEPA